MREPPCNYLKKIQTYLDPKASRSLKVCVLCMTFCLVLIECLCHFLMTLQKRKALGDSTSTQVLKDLEISLRTNNIEWVREFLNEENKGLDVLVNYLNFRLAMMRYEYGITLHTAVLCAY